MSGGHTPASWSQRWRAVFDDTAPLVGRRLAQGAAYARSGRVTDVRARPGALSGRVQGSRATPNLVEITLPVLPPEAWDATVAAIAGQVRHSARLLAGQAPEGLERGLEPLGVHLFPVADDLAVACPCGDDAVPCAHAAAIWEDVARRLDDDPFLLLRLRGRGRERLLADMAAARRRGGATREAGSLPVADLDTAGWTRARTPLEGVEIPHATGAVTPAATLRLLGDPPGWRGGVDATDLFGPLVARGAEHVRALLAEADAPPAEAGGAEGIEPGEEPGGEGRGATG